MIHCIRLGLPLLALACSALAEEGRVSLVTNGKPSACIVIAKDGGGCVPFAAQELQLHLAKMSGAKLPIIKVGDATEAPLREVTKGKLAVLLGASVHASKLGMSADRLKADGFRIRTGDGWLAVVGRDDATHGTSFRWAPTGAGTLYGVYRVLEELGVRWF